MKKDVAIIGAGPAGSIAAMRLARCGRSVILIEKDTFPRHRLCGEFLSVEVLGYLQALGLDGLVWEAGARPVRRVLLSAPDGACFETVLPGTAIGLSRYALDRLLAEAAVRDGAELRQDCTVRGVEGDLDSGFSLDTSHGPVEARCVVGAYGKRANLDRILARRFFDRPTPYVAFEAHYRGNFPDDLIEMHGFDGGYCGISPVENGLVNVCWIGHRCTLKQAGKSPEAMISEVLSRNPLLARRLDGLQRVSDRFTAISQISFAGKTAFEKDICMIGDTAGLITPLCGDGMAVAMHSATLAATWIDRWLSGKIEAGVLRKGYSRAWKRTFSTRFRVGRFAHWAGCRPSIARLSIQAIRQVPAMGEAFIRATREAPTASLPLRG